MKPRHPKTTIALAVGAIVLNLVAGTALGQTVGTGKGQRTSAALPAGPPPAPPATASGIPVTIDPVTGAVTGPNGAALVMIPGTTTVVLPASTGGAATAISGIAVPANSPQVAAMLAAFAGSSANLNSLLTGLGNRSAVTLTGAAGNATFVPPTAPLTSTDATQALLISLSQLAALGVRQPTPQQIQASLVGGNVLNTSGQSVPLPGVLQLRNRGLTFAQIAQGVVTPPAGNASATETPAPTLGRVRPGASVGSQAGLRAGASASTTSGSEAGTPTGTTTSSPTGSTIGTQGTTPGFTASGTPGAQGTSPGFTASGSPGAQGSAPAGSTAGGTSQAGAASRGGSVSGGGSR